MKRRALNSIRQTFNRLRPERVNSSRVYLERFVHAAAASVPDGSLVLDAGAGNCQYRTLFAGKHYQSTDLCQTDMSYGKLTYVCNLVSIPMKNNVYDLILFTQTLEHVTDPLTVLAGLYRVLTPGGELWLSAPLFYEEHEAPYDFFRYTRFGLAHLLSECGFQIVSLEPLEGYYGTLSYQLDTASRALPLCYSPSGYTLRKWVWGPLFLLLKPLFYLLALFFGRLDLNWKINAGLCKNYTVVAEK